MRVVVASEAARVCRARIRNGSGSVCRDHVRVKIDEPLPRNARAAGTHSVGSMASGTRETVIDMPGVLGETGIRHDLIQVVTLGAHRIGTVHGEVGVRE